MTLKVVGIGDAASGQDDDILVSYALGSCVGICLYDAKSKIGGLVHILLPDSTSIKTKAPNDIYRYADTGILALYHELLKLGASRIQLKAKIFGGAQMFTSSINTGVGKRNVQSVRDVLQDLHVPICGEDVEGNHGRSIWLYCENGQVKVKSIANKNKRI